MRRYADLHGDKRTFLGAVAGVVVTDEARTYALNQDGYVIEPSVSKPSSVLKIVLFWACKIC